MNELERLTHTLTLSILIEKNKRKSMRVTAYLKIAEKAYKKFLLWNDRLMRYDQAERKREDWTKENTKIKTARIAESAWQAHKRCMDSYVSLVKSL